MQQAAAEASQAELDGSDPPGITLEQLVRAFEAQLRGIVDQLKEHNVGSYTDLPDGVRVATLRRIPQPAHLPWSSSPQLVPTRTHTYIPMNERTRPQNERTGGPGGASRPLRRSAGLPTARHCLQRTLRRAVAGRATCPWARSAAAFATGSTSIPTARRVLDGHDVADDIVVRPGQALLFTRRGWRERA